MSNKKETFYFSHDCGATSDPKIQALLGTYGSMGYGIYWRLVEMLHEEPTHKIILKPYIYQAIGSTMKEEVEIIEDIITYCVECCELFILEDKTLYSKRVFANIEKRDKIKEARSIAGKKSAEVRSKANEEKLTSVEQKATNKSKVKQSKTNKKNDIDWDKFLSFFNSTFSKNNRVFNDSNKAKYIARLKEGYLAQDISKAMIKASKDQFHIDNQYKYCTLEYFARATTLDKYGYETQKKNNYVPTK